MKRIGLPLLGILLVIAIAYPAWQSEQATAQSGGRNLDSSGTRDGGRFPPPRTFRDAPPPRPFVDRFWSWMSNAQYRNWGPAPGQDGDFYPGQSPHGAYLKMYFNRPAAANPDNPPHGSIIVKENYGDDQQTLMAITIMYKIDGYDPANGDWYWVKYEPNGQVSRNEGKAIAGRVKSCAECHAGADGDDFLFVND